MPSSRCWERAAGPRRTAPPRPGGKGGKTTAVVEVTPGEIFELNVGCQGEPADAADAQGGAGGWGGSDRILVAGGGGGAWVTAKGGGGGGGGGYRGGGGGGSGIPRVTTARGGGGGSGFGADATLESGFNPGPGHIAITIWPA